MYMSYTHVFIIRVYRKALSLKSVLALKKIKIRKNKNMTRLRRSKVSLRSTNSRRTCVRSDVFSFTCIYLIYFVFVYFLGYIFWL
jgi:hypothetical protein